MTDTDYVVSQFRTHFLAQEEKKIVIYGIGPNTKALLEAEDSKAVVGLMDEVKTGVIYGKPILSMEEVVAQKVDFIVIVARLVNVQMIFRRIQADCQRHNIPVYDMSGTVVTLPQATEKEFTSYQNITEDRLKKAIDSVDVVSFDVFDTLVMRKVLYPRDVFYCMEAEHGVGFAKRRMEAEQLLSQKGGHPTLEEIYALLPEFSWETEVDYEKKYLVPRRAVCQMIEYAKSQGKQVYFTSDMYLTGDVLWGILTSLGIHIQRDHLLVSCDYGVSKSSGLFDVLKEKAGLNKVLHIGDNIEADIISAEKYGIDQSFPLKMASTMLEDSYGSDLLQYEKSLPSRVAIGEFIASELNNPFLFGETKGKFRADTMVSLGYSYIAPLIYRFFSWMVAEAKRMDIHLILLGARDGFLIEKLYQQCLKQGVSMAKMEYVETSRQVAVLAGIKTQEDLEYASSYAFRGTPEAMLESRFRLQPQDILPFDGGDREEYVKSHQEVIAQSSENTRRNYLRYLEQFHIPTSGKVGFFDFFASGTCQKAMQNILECELIGFYFAMVSYRTDYKPNTQVQSLFGRLNTFAESYHLTQDYFFLENVMTSYTGTLQDITSSGEPVYQEETRSQGKRKQQQDIHQGILQFCQDSVLSFEDWCEVDIHVVDLLCHLMKPSSTEWGEENFCDQLEDEFCGRSLGAME